MDFLGHETIVLQIYVCIYYSLLYIKNTNKQFTNRKFCVTLNLFHKGTFTVKLYTIDRTTETNVMFNSRTALFSLCLCVPDRMPPACDLLNMSCQAKNRLFDDFHYKYCCRCSPLLRYVLS